MRRSPHAVDVGGIAHPLKSGEKDAPTDDLGAGVCGVKETLLGMCLAYDGGRHPLRGSSVALLWTRYSSQRSMRSFGNSLGR